MARSSGMMGGVDVPHGEVEHSASGSRYRIGDGGRLEFARGQQSGFLDPEFFIGSGAAGRSFFWQNDGFLFQLPVSWYASRGWEMSPGYESNRALSIARPIEPECLNCHATGVKHRAGTRNGYDWPPVREGGIGCERCHGPGSEHVAKTGKAPMANPAKMPPHLRDSVCAQCHLTGVERIVRAGRRLADFRPGEDFSDYAVSFVWENPDADPVHTTSHFERLSLSGCKKAAGDKLWCGSCHNPHTWPAGAGRMAYYRSKCMACHEESGHAAGQSQCLPCHMPSRPARDAPHAVFTDHAIPRRPLTKEQPVSRELRPFSGPARSRDLGLAWARIANVRQRPEEFQLARSLLNRAFDEGDRDAVMLAALAYLEDRAGNEARAAALYEQVRGLDPSQIEALVNLGSTHAMSGRLAAAIQLWREAAKRSPGTEAAWVKLATAYNLLGQRAEAAEAAKTCLFYHPDSPACLAIQNELQRGGR